MAAEQDVPKVRDSGNFGKRRDKKRKFQGLKASCVRAQELLEFRSGKKVVEPTAELLDSHLD